MIFSWPDLARLHTSRSASARDALVKMLTDIQDATDYRVAVVFDGKGLKPNTDSQPHGIHVFYSKTGQTADSIIERLAAKYAVTCDVTVATNDHLERITAETFGSSTISSTQLRSEMDSAQATVQAALKALARRKAV